MDDINEILHKIQKDLICPKNQYNKFGGYNYRSCEDILEAAKKLLPEGVHLTLSDLIESHGDRVFIKSIAKISKISTNDNKLEQFITSHGCAEIAKEQKGMQAAQITGSASSYARKYALNGLFCIDDTKDSDSNENKDQSDNTPKPDTPNPPYKPEETQEDSYNRAYAFSEKAKEAISKIETTEKLRKWQKENSKGLDFVDGFEVIAKDLIKVIDYKLKELEK